MAMNDKACSSSGKTDSDLSGFNDQESGIVTPLLTCPHLEQLCAKEENLTDSYDKMKSCSKCDHIGENWVCLTCHEVNCSRFVNGHAAEHFQQQTASGATSHPMAISYSDLSVWCYPCEAYIHNELLIPAKEALHRMKFGEGSGTPSI